MNERVFTFTSAETTVSGIRITTTITTTITVPERVDFPNVREVGEVTQMANNHTMSRFLSYETSVRAAQEEELPF